jgi:serine/threonine-protein kinase
MSDSPEFPKSPQQVGETPLASAAAQGRVGLRVGDYEIRDVIGEDEAGVLYSARHAAEGGQVTLQILDDRYASKKDVVEQFIGDTRAAIALRHRNIVEVIDLGITPEGTAFLAMENLPGESLRNRLRQVQRLPPFEAINVLRQAVLGLGAAHEAHIVHGALKPDSIFLCKQEGRRRIVRRSKAKGMRYGVEREGSFDLVKLLDFGVARLIASAPGNEAGFRGAIHYLSPEQAQGQPPDQRGDIYALGVVLYEMVTGAVPFGGGSLADLVRAHTMGMVIPPSRRAPGAGIDARMDALISRCLKKNPLLRFSSAGELFAALDACITDCAFLRDAHRLPGIAGSGIDLSEGSPQSRHEPEQSAELPATAPVAEKPAVAAVLPKPATAPARKPATLSSAQASTEATTVAPPAAARIAPPEPPAPPAPPVVQAEDPSAAVLTPPPVVQAEDPSAAVPTPPPVVQAEDPSAAMLTPPPVAQAEDPSAAVPTPPPIAAAAATRADLEERPVRSAAEAAVRSGKPERAGSHRSQVFALLVILLLGGGIAIWAARGGWVPGTTKSLTASPPPAVPKAALPPPPLAPSLVAKPGVPAESAPSVVAPAAVPPEPAATAEAAPSVAVPAAVPAAAPPVATAPTKPAPSVATVPPKPAARAAVSPKAAAPAEPHRPLGKHRRSATHASGKHASARARIASARRARHAAPAAPKPTATATAPAAEPLPEPPAPGKTASAPAPAPVTVPAEPANAEDLLQEAQRTRKRGHFAAAIGKARAALAAEPTPAQAAQAYELIGICACARGDASTAREAAGHLADSRRDMVKAMCEEMGQKID